MRVGREREVGYYDGSREGAHLRHQDVEGSREGASEGAYYDGSREGA